MVDRDIKMSFSMDAILDLLFQVKEDRFKLISELSHSEELRHEARQKYEERENESEKFKFPLLLKQGN